MGRGHTGGRARAPGRLEGERPGPGLPHGDRDHPGGDVGSLPLLLAGCRPDRRRTPETDALEFALVTLLTVIFSPLSFNYAYVWLLYPITLALHRVSSEPAETPGHRFKVAWLAAVLLIPALAIPMPQVAQACGNLFVPALLLVFGLGAMLSGGGRRPEQAEVPPPHLREHDHRGSRPRLRVCLIRSGAGQDSRGSRRARMSDDRGQRFGKIFFVFSSYPDFSV